MTKTGKSRSVEIIKLYYKGLILKKKGTKLRV